MTCWISSEDGFYIVRIRKKTIKRVCTFIVFIALFTMVFMVFHSYRYERFKDGHKYMRYDKWLDKYEKYDVPTRKWEDLKKMTCWDSVARIF